ncbi:unnamed protein product [Sphagnum troendelagicum]|uniref:Uncharacterized protein n=1 Tax=Sphagnum troendelagicum TaxID=128251 RepID=A0ABP0TGX5_9BRYO
MSESSANASGSRASPSAPSAGRYQPPHMRFLLNNNNPEQAPNYRSSPSLRTPRKVVAGSLASLNPKLSVTCFSARNAPNADQPGTTTDLSSTEIRESALEDVLFKRFCSNQPSWLPDILQSDKFHVFLYDSRIPSSPPTGSLGTSSSSDRELGQHLQVNSTPPPPSSKSWSSTGAAITAAATDRQKVCGDWKTSNYSDVLVGTLRQIADSTIQGSLSAAPTPRPRLKIEVRVAKCFFKHFVSGTAAAAPESKRRNYSFSSDAAGVARQALTSSYNWSSSCFSIPQLQEQISSRQLTHQAITETTTMDNIARAQAYVQQAPCGFKELPGAPQSERKIVVHFHDTLSSNDTGMAITIRYPADDPKMMIQARSVDKEKDGGHETMEQQHHGLSEADHLAAGREEDQQCANDIKLLRPKFSNVKHYLKTRECMVQFLREGRGADFRLVVLTKNQVPQESSTSSDPAILEWVKQAWDSRTAGSLVFPANPRFKIKLVRYKDVIHRYYSENVKVSLLKIRQVSEDEAAASRVKNFWEINLQCLQIEKHWIADLEEKNLVAIEHMVYELVEEATKLTDAMGEVYIPY